MNHKIADRLTGKNALNQIEIDQIMLEADGTPNKERFGANAILEHHLQLLRQPLVD